MFTLGSPAIGRFPNMPGVSSLRSGDSAQDIGPGLGQSGSRTVEQAGTSRTFSPLAPDGVGKDTFSQGVAAGADNFSRGVSVVGKVTFALEALEIAARQVTPVNELAEHETGELTEPVTEAIKRIEAPSGGQADAGGNCGNCDDCDCRGCDCGGCDCTIS